MNRRQDDGVACVVGRLSVRVAPPPEPAVLGIFLRGDRLGHVEIPLADRLEAGAQRRVFLHDVKLEARVHGVVSWLSSARGARHGQRTEQHGVWTLPNSGRLSFRQGSALRVVSLGAVRCVTIVVLHDLRMRRLERDIRSGGRTITCMRGASQGECWRDRESWCSPRRKGGKIKPARGPIPGPTSTAVDNLGHLTVRSRAGTNCSFGLRSLTPPMPNDRR